jgi:hypothetical protein
LAVVTRSPDEERYGQVHKVAYMDLKTRDVFISKLQGMISNVEGTARLHRAFVDLSTMAISTKTFAKVSWSLDASLVPCHIAGCLGMVTYISVGKTVSVAPLYRRYASLVEGILSVCSNDADREEHGREFAAMVARHAETTADYVGFFVSAGDIIRLSVEQVDGMNAAWMNKLLDRMSTRVALARERFAFARTVRVMMSLKDDEDGADAGQRAAQDPAD